MKQFLIITIILIFSKKNIAEQRELPWRLSGETTLTATVDSYSQNWSRRNTGTITWICRANNTFNKPLSERILSETILRLAFGQTKIRNRDSNRWSSPRTTTDLIDFQSVLRYSLDGFIDPYTSTRISTQFHDTRDEVNTRYLNPACFTQSFGITKDLLSTSELRWRMRMGGAFRTKIDRDTLIYERTGRNNISTGLYETSIVNDGGTELVTELRMRKSDWLTFNTKLLIYEALVRPGPKQNNHWRYPDISWENSLKIDLTKHVVLNYYLHVIYDREIDRAPKIRQTFSGGISLSYSAKN